MNCFIVGSLLSFASPLVRNQWQPMLTAHGEPCPLPIGVSPSETAWHLYLMPMIGDGGIDNVFRPKYGTNLLYAGKQLGPQLVCLLAMKTDPETDDTLSNLSDVTRIPDNIDNNIGGALSQVQAAMESRNIPADWVTSGMTYRFVMRAVLRACVFMTQLQCIRAVKTEFLDGTVTLSTQFGDLPQLAKNQLQAAAVYFNIDTTGVTAKTTLRTILKLAINSLPESLITMGGVSI